MGKRTWVRFKRVINLRNLDDGLLLELMLHVYDEDVDCSRLVDEKNSRMILLTGAMLTLEVTLLSSLWVNCILFNDGISFLGKFSSCGLLFVSLLFLFVSLICFIFAYAFSMNFESVPDSSFLVDSLFCEDFNMHDFQGGLLATFEDVIKGNDKIINDKIGALLKSSKSFE